MNEQIKELMKKQCYVSVADRDGDSEYDMEKFAALIIKECANYAFSDDQERNAMLKHFGVE